MMSWPRLRLCTVLPRTTPKASIFLPGTSLIVTISIFFSLSDLFETIHQHLQRADDAARRDAE